LIAVLSNWGLVAQKKAWLNASIASGEICCGLNWPHMLTLCKYCSNGRAVETVEMETRWKIYRFESQDVEYILAR